MQGPASMISTGLRHLKRLHDHALPRKGSIAVQHNGDHCFTDSIFPPILTCAHRALYHGRHNLKVRGVEGQRQMHFATRRHHIGGESLVVFHVTGPDVRHLPFKFVR